MFFATAMVSLGSDESLASALSDWSEASLGSLGSLTCSRAGIGGVDVDESRFGANTGIVTDALSCITSTWACLSASWMLVTPVDACQSGDSAEESVV